MPILFRPEPYDAWSWVARVGQRSATIESVICDGDTTLARARVTIVFFDQATQRSTVPPEATSTGSGRARLTAERAHSNVLTMNCAAWVT